MASQGPNSAATFANDPTSGVTWTNVSNAASSNNSYAIFVGLPNDYQTTVYLKCTNFGFSIPGGATIDGIEVAIERKASVQSGVFWVRDFTVKLYKAGTIVGTDKADTGLKWPTSDTDKTYGSSSDLWGETWSNSDINNSGFGIGIKVATIGGGNPKDPNVTAFIDWIRITVYYTTGGGGSVSQKIIMPRQAIKRASNY